MNYAEWPLSAPVNVTWEITHECNLRCIHCLSASDAGMPDELSLDECKTIVDQMAELRRFSADRRISATAGKTEAERALTQLERDSEFVKAVREGVTTVTGILTVAAERFDLAAARDDTI